MMYILSKLYKGTQVIINWETYVARLIVVDLDHWCDRINEINSSFLSISFNHIHRENNSSADGLSKEALTMEMGNISFFEYMDGEIIGNWNIRLF